jgi:hypothetical protein
VAKKDDDKAPLISPSAEADVFGRPVREDREPEKAYVDAADPKQIEAAKKEEGQRRREDRDFYQLLMSTPARRASFYRILERGHIYGSPADLGNAARGADALATYYALGEENFAKQMMLSAMDASLDLYLQMLKEQKEVKDKRDRKS